MSDKKQSSLSASGAASQRVLSSTPLYDLADRLGKEVDALKRRTPHSDVVSTMTSIREELLRAIVSAGQIELWLTVEQVHEITNKPFSTLRRECAAHGTKIGASKQHGQWYVYWPHYETYLKTVPSSQIAA